MRAPAPFVDAASFPAAGEPVASAMGRRGGLLFRMLMLAGGAVLLFMMMITVADVVLRHIDPRLRISGILDYVELSLDVLIYLAIPLAFLAREHIAIDLVDSLVSGRTLRWLMAFGAALSFAAVTLLGVITIEPALDMLRFGESTLDLGIPKFYYWLPIWIGLGASALILLVQIPAHLSSLRAKRS